VMEDDPDREAEAQTGQSGQIAGDRNHVRGGVWSGVRADGCGARC
jgi:hypothetical protein